MNAVPTFPLLLAVVVLTLACVGCFVAEAVRTARTRAEIEDRGLRPAAGDWLAVQGTGSTTSRN